MTLQTTMPSRDAIETLGWEMSLRMSTNQVETWARILHTLTPVAPDEWATRCRSLVDTLNALVPAGITQDRLDQPVSRDEAFALGVTGHRMSTRGIVALLGLLYRVQREIGATHNVTRPVRWYTEGLARRTQLLVARHQEGK